MQPELRGRVGCLLLLLLLSPAFAQPEVSHDDVLEVTGQIVCNCGCPPTLVRACSCHRAGEMNEEVRAMLTAGRTTDEILDSYVEQFGLEILAAPPKEGFNLFGWTFPFIAVAIGAGLVALAIFRLRGDRTGEVAVVGSQLSDDERARIQRELAR